MNAKAEPTQNSLDTVKFGAALALLLIAIVAFYYFADQSKLARYAGLLVALGGSVALALQTDKGRIFLGFIRESQVEVRKVVWPTRQETVQTTLVVMFVVVVASILLWLLDLALGGLVRLVMGQGA